MTAFLVFPQSVSVQARSDNSDAAILRVTEKPVIAARPRTFEFSFTREELQQLREDIANVLLEEQLPE